MFKRKMKPCTPEQQLRQDRARALGCIACQLEELKQPGRIILGMAGYSQIHHQTDTGRQLTQDDSVCLCSWHHQGHCVEGKTTSQMTEAYGPSIAKGTKPFYECYGRNEEQLAFQNDLIECAYGVVHG